MCCFPGCTSEIVAFGQEEMTEYTGDVATNSGDKDCLAIACWQCHIGEIFDGFGERSLAILSTKPSAMLLKEICIHLGFKVTVKWEDLN